MYKNDQIERFVNALTDLALNSQDPGLLREGIENIVRCFLANEPAAPAVKDSFDRLAVLDALESAKNFIVNGVEFGYIQLPDYDCPDPARQTLPKIRAAIEALKTQPSGNPGQLAGSQAVSDTALLDWIEAESPTIKPELVAMGDTGDYDGEIVVYDSCMNPRDQKRLGAGETYRAAIIAAMKESQE